MSADRAWPRHSLRWLWTILIAGALLRIAQYCSSRSLWCDEALLALNVLHRSWSGLLKPLDYNQDALSPFADALFQGWGKDFSWCSGTSAAREEPTARTARRLSQQ